MADQLFPVFDLPEIPDDPEYEEDTALQWRLTSIRRFCERRIK